MRALKLVPVLAPALAAGWSAASAHAAPCGRPDLVDMVPPDMASDVPTNATLAAHYLASAEYLGEDVILVRPDGEEQVLPATFDATEGQLRVTPTEPLEPGAAYTVRWPALRGLNAAAPGRGGEASFIAGWQADGEAPTFGGVTGVRWDLERRNNDCTDSLEERFLFDIDLAAAGDDGGRGGLTLLVFQSSGPRVTEGSVPVLTRALPPEGSSVRVALARDDAIGHICFAALVRDTTGQISSGSGSEEACVNTTTPPFFRGCNLSAGRRPEVGLLAGLALLALAARPRRRR